MSLRRERRDNLVEITLDRPDALNALTQELVTELDQAVTEAMADEDVGAMLIRGAGERAFCAGADVSYFHDALEEGRAREVVGDLSEGMNEVLERLVTGPKPVLAAITGVAAGGGLGLALASDIRVAGPEARFATAFRDVGISPDGATTWLLPRIVGWAQAREMLLENREIDASKAREWGMVHEVTHPSEVLDRARKRAKALASGPAGVFARTKRLLGDQRDFGEHMDREATFTRESAGTAAFREGMEAFAEKREPDFS